MQARLRVGGVDDPTIVPRSCDVIDLQPAGTIAVHALRRIEVRILYPGAGRGGDRCDNRLEQISPEERCSEVGVEHIQSPGERSRVGAQHLEVRGLSLADRLPRYQLSRYYVPE